MESSTILLVKYNLLITPSEANDVVKLRISKFSNLQVDFIFLLREIEVNRNLHKFAIDS